MEEGKLGKIYPDGAVIVRQGEEGDQMFVIQSGRVRVTCEADGKEFFLVEMKEGELFGEMSLIEKEVRSATVTAIGEVRLLSIDKKSFLRRVHEDPSLAYRILQRMSHRIRELTNEVAELKSR